MKRALLAAERAAYEAWWKAHHDVDPDVVRADGWTVRDVVAHVAAWHSYSTERIAALVRTGSDRGPPEDVDRFNGEARSAAQSWYAVREGASEAHQRLLDLVTSIPEDRLAEDDGLIPFIVRVNVSEHYEEHPATDFTR